MVNEPSYTITPKKKSPYVLKHVFAYPFLLHEVLAVSALRLSTSRPALASFNWPEATLLQSRALLVHVTSAYTELLVQRKPEALVILGHFAMHQLRSCWTVGVRDEAPDLGRSAFASML
jgi:hypothetical protein